MISAGGKITLSNDNKTAVCDMMAVFLSEKIFFVVTLRLIRASICSIIIAMRKSFRRSRSRMWRDTRRQRQFDIKKFLASVLVVSVPLMIFCITANVLMRMNDIYDYSLESSGVIDNMTISTSKEEVVGSITKFMQHRSDELTLVSNYGYEPQELYSEEDKEAMGQTRRLLDIMLVIGILALLATAASYFFLIRWRVKAIFMKRFKLAAVVFLVIEALNVITLIVSPLRKAVYGWFIPMDFPDGDNLVMFLSDAFPAQVAVFELIVGTVLLLILAYGTWSVAGKKKMFKG